MYNSTARDSAKADTRIQILEAVVQVVLEEGLHAFTVQNVAKRAGVAHRTVYRHFPTRDALLDGLSEQLEDSITEAGLPNRPTSVDEIRTVVEPIFERMGDMADATRAYVITSVALGFEPEGRAARTAAVAKTLKAAYPKIPAGERRRAAALIRTLVSSRTWFSLTCELGLKSKDAGAAARWALQLLLDDLQQRNDSA